MASRNPRIMITLPEGIGRAIDYWASLEGSKPATLCTSFVEAAVRQAIADGIIPVDVLSGNEPKEEKS